MVVFTCSHCGDSLQKPKVSKHYETKCRRNNPALTCVDCLKDFFGDEYVAHTKCMTEQERYSAKGYVAKPSQNKGEKKQTAWIEMIETVLSEQKSISSSVKNILQKVSQQPNTPRKKPKFENFVKNIVGHRANARDVTAAWDLISVKLSELSSVQNKGSVSSLDTLESDSNSKTFEVPKDNQEDNGSPSELHSTEEFVEEISKSNKKKKNKSIVNTDITSIPLDPVTVADVLDEKKMSKKELKKLQKQKKLEVQGNEPIDILVPTFNIKADKRESVLSNFDDTVDANNEENALAGMTTKIEETLDKKKLKKLKKQKKFESNVNKHTDTLEPSFDSEPNKLESNDRSYNETVEANNETVEANNEENVSADMRTIIGKALGKKELNQLKKQKRPESQVTEQTHILEPPSDIKPGEQKLNDYNEENAESITSTKKKSKRDRKGKDNGNQLALENLTNISTGLQSGLDETNEIRDRQNMDKSDKIKKTRKNKKKDSDQITLENLTNITIESGQDETNEIREDRQNGDKSDKNKKRRKNGKTDSDQIALENLTNIPTESGLDETNKIRDHQNVDKSDKIKKRRKNGKLDSNQIALENVTNIPTELGLEETNEIKEAQQNADKSDKIKKRYKNKKTDSNQIALENLTTELGQEETHEVEDQQIVENFDKIKKRRKNKNETDNQQPQDKIDNEIVEKSEEVHNNKRKKQKKHDVDIPDIANTIGSTENHVEDNSTNKKKRNKSLISEDLNENEIGVQNLNGKSKKSKKVH